MNLSDQIRRTPRPRLLSRMLYLVAALALLAGAPRLQAQTVDENHPGPLSPGVNKGVVDSIAGNPNWWMVWVNPGSFTVRFHWEAEQEFVHTKEIVQFGCALRPREAGRITFEADQNHNVTCHGSVTKRAYIALAVFPKPSRLVRQTNHYTLSVEGPTVDYSGAPAAGTAADNVTGTYNVMIGVVTGRPAYTMAKFLPNGQITTPEGFTGRWKLFDADSKAYSILFDGRQITDVYQPGRGFADRNGNVDFQSVGH